MKWFGSRKGIRRKLTIGAGLALVLGGLAVIHTWKAMGSAPGSAELESLKRSPAFRDGRFRNELTRRDDVWGIVSQIAGRQERSPREPLPIQRRRAEDYARAPQSLRLTWFGHSSILIELDGKKVLTDPVWGHRTSPSSIMGPKRFHEPPLPLEELPHIDAVLISHDHYDHLDYPTIKALAKTQTRFYVPLGVGSHLTYWGIPRARIQEMDWWEEVDSDGLRLVFTPARHFSGRGLTRDKSLWGGWAVIGSQSVFFSGDSGMFPGFYEIGRRLGPFDVTFMESGAYNGAWRDVHMGPEQAVQAHRMVGGQLMIPIHWGTFNLAFHAWTEPAERVLAAAEKKGVDVYIPRQGELIDPTNLPNQQIWWPQLSWQTAEQAPVVSSALPETLAMELLSGY